MGMHEHDKISFSVSSDFKKLRQILKLFCMGFSVKHVRALWIPCSTVFATYLSESAKCSFHHLISFLLSGIPIVYILATVPPYLLWDNSFRFLSWCHLVGNDHKPSHFISFATFIHSVKQVQCPRGVGVLFIICLWTWSRGRTCTTDFCSSTCLGSGWVNRLVSVMHLMIQLKRWVNHKSSDFNLGELDEQNDKTNCTFEWNYCGRRRVL